MLIFKLFYVFTACVGTKSNEDTFKDCCIHKTDTLWSVLAETRKNFNYQMNEITERRRDMDSQLHILKFASGNMLSEEDKADIVKYHSIFLVYKRIADAYKETVLKAESDFYEVMVLNKSVKKDEYKNKQKEFKTIWNQLKIEMDKNAAEAKSISEGLKSLEPMYLRLQPKIEMLVEKASSMN